uniref:Uncharacterized protein n=1 Tax=Picea glauca TaxID=3330 RepID=A0A101M5N7_PICGL|nr:hypothetical protein ABT39_MTgene1236 [Picea glauca]QHR92382.1 hypothetical protein Q903MT_gene6425 [Picea sitchensis]
MASAYHLQYIYWAILPSNTSGLYSLLYSLLYGLLTEWVIFKHNGLSSLNGLSS